MKNIKEKLTKHGVEFDPKSPKEIWEIIEKKDPMGQKKFLELIQTFIVLLKSNNLNFETLNKKVSSGMDTVIAERSKKFLEIIKPIFTGYENHLHLKREIDFSDMINLATDCIQKKEYDRTFDYIIVDEFQDMSIGRYNLLKSLKITNPFCKLFAVGDDWQSIYRFAGSDIAIFNDFEKYFGYAKFSKIETTYRFSDPLMKKSSEFILKNPNQIRKTLKNPNIKYQTSIDLACYSSYNSESDSNIINFQTALAKLIEEQILTDTEYKEKSVLLLGRYNNDIKRIAIPKKVDTKRFGTFTVSNNIVTYSCKRGNLTMQFLSVHKAKGIESDIVIVINNDAGDYGFPSLRSDDPLLGLLLSQADQFANSEERRLFYVALTRAKEKLFLLASNEQKSKFIVELFGDEGQDIKCPKCKTGDKILKQGIKKETGTKWSFIACSNFAYGCEYQDFKST